MRLVFQLLLLATALSGCKKRPVGDQSTPEQAVASFFAAFNRGDIPDDLDAYLSDPNELHLWRFRCKQKGCRKAEYKIVDSGPSNDYHVELFVDYALRGHDGNAYVRAKHSRFQVELEGKRWMIQQIGDRLPPTSPPSPARGETP